MAVSGNEARCHCWGLIHLSLPRALSSPGKQGHHQLLTSQGTRRIRVITDVVTDVVTGVKRFGKVQRDERESVLPFQNGDGVWHFLRIFQTVCHPAVVGLFLPKETEPQYSHIMLNEFH